MQRASAMGARAGWADVFTTRPGGASGTNGRLSFVDTGGRDATVPDVAGRRAQQRDVAHGDAEHGDAARRDPAQAPSISTTSGQDADRRLPRAEAWLRRIVPMMVLLLLALAVGARAFMLSLNADAVESTARETIAVAAELVGERLVELPGLDAIEDDPALAAQLLASVDLPADGRATVLATSTGKLIAMAGYGNGDPLHVRTAARPETVAPVLPSLLVSLTKGGTQRIELRDGSTHLAAASRATVLASGATLVALVLVDEAVLYAPLMRGAGLEGAVLAGIAFALAVMLFAYLRQNARTQRASAQHQDERTRFHTALIRGRCGMWDWDLSRADMKWSQSMFQILGYEPGDGRLSVADVSALVHPDDLDVVALGNDALRTKGGALDRRFRMRTASGDWTWVRMRAELVAAARGEPHLIGIAVDISEQEALERESERADTLLRDAVESSSEAFVLWDARRRLVLWNSKFAQFHGLTGKVLARGARYEEVAEASRQYLSRRKVNIMRETEDGASTEEIELDDGRWLQVNERRTKDGGMVSVQTDITQIKRNEEKLLHSERSLMASVADLKQTQLQLEIGAQHLEEIVDMYRVASEKAEAANRIKSDFMANISHELRTPLNAILGFSDIMTAQMFGPMGSEKYSEYAHDIHDSGQFLLGVINDVLDMSKIEAGRMQLAPEALDLTATLDESLRIIDVQANQKELVLHRHVPDDVALEADRRALKQILLNLLSNAVKFTPHGGSIHVKVRRGDGVVRMAIADTGCGIDAASLKRIGRPFEQAQNAFTKDHKGSGLGLAIARSLAELHGGSLDIRSIVDRGTFVLVRLPETQPEATVPA